ncbi:MAG TPA: DUF2071 domain-containing protein [Bacteroidia bacterium]|nr:MAG: hypothetical protein UZ10_BCD003001484 [Bacteroidetes bacterium OLB10]MBV6454926.1 hypothetical protein [Bacteroidia bacterium]MBX3106769.1 DUF2071 domain-containing protein [Bacteroidota bacterium]MCB0849583.1 DUF2071 domain-containing protein [Bacteroidota bacterium]MCB8929469.1 DUF2071 domain-containing protein [Bacteroidia bacterium]
MDNGQIALDAEHIPFDLPEGKWSYYQEWNKVLFLHWKVPFNILRQIVPKKLNVDTFNGDAYVSLVAFTMQKMKYKNVPALKFISDFDELNVRTYINNDSKRGVYFINILAQKYLSALIAKTLSGLPYTKAEICRSENNYKANSKSSQLSMDVDYEVKENIHFKTELDKWLTERYCLYLIKSDKVYRYYVHHKEWEIKDVDISKLNIHYTSGQINLTKRPDITHFSDGVKVLAWNRQHALD